MQWRRATTFASRLRGLLGHAPLQDTEALWIEPCNSVHTFGMGYAIDVVFLDGQRRILKIVPAMQPWRAALCWQARSVVELSAGQAHRLGLREGQQWPRAVMR